MDKVTLDEFIVYCNLAGLVITERHPHLDPDKTIVVKRGEYKGVIQHEAGEIYSTTLFKKDRFGTELFEQPGLQTIYSKMVNEQ